jgi:hypothetical protein
MKASRLALCALLAFACVGIAPARPVVIEESAVLAPPDPSWQYFGTFGVAIDGDYALVSGMRLVPDENSEGGMRPDGAAFLYQRSGQSWTYVGMLGSVGVLSEWIRPGLAMKDGIAMVITNGAHIFERTGESWTQAPYTGGWAAGLQGPDIEIDSGRILVSRIACTHDSAVLGKLNGQWRVEGDLTGHTNSCGDTPPSNLQDLQGNLAVIFNGLGSNDERPVVRGYLPDESGTGWRSPVVFEDQGLDTRFGPDVALAGSVVAITGSREKGTSVLWGDGFSWGWSLAGLQPIDGYLQPGALSATSLERVGTLVAQRNFSHDRAAYVINLFSVRSESPHTNEHVATLQGKGGVSLGGFVDGSGNRIIVSERDNVGGANRVRVFELPANFDNIDVHGEDFGGSSAGADWQPSAGSSFVIGSTGVSHVYRQQDTNIDASSLLPGSVGHNQAIQGEVTVRKFNGADRWVGLTTRRSSDSNYYYVTLRSSGSVQLRRMWNGTFTTLASAPAAVVAGRTYRLRLESIGSAQRVYLDDRLVLTAWDDKLSQGAAGVAMYRASADYDNVVVSPSPFTTIYRQDFSTGQPGNWINLGAWSAVDGVYRQSSTAGDARAVIGASTDDQIVQVRVRPTLLAGGGTRWVGVIARYKDDDEYLYVTLRNDNTLSLRRVGYNRIVHIIKQKPFTVTAGQWYTVRIEIVNELTKVFVNDVLQFETNADPGPTDTIPALKVGKVGLVTYRATADFDDFLAYQP